MVKKKELLKECKNTMLKPKIQKWYSENLETESQYETINSLEKGVSKKEISLREALEIALVVGVQWNIKFGENQA